MLKVPKVWQDLLAIEDFKALATYPAKSVSVCLNPAHPRTDGAQGVRNDYPIPLRDEHRVVSFEENGYTVQLGLLSGDKNYWTLVTVFDPHGQVYEADEVSNEISPEESIARGPLRFEWQQACEG